MKTKCFTKAALLLACCLFVPSNSIMPKPGHCRKYFESFAPLKPCHYDRDCPGADKCCLFDYGSVCAPPIPTTLQCPRPGIGLCFEGCSSDDECTNGELCCSNGCGHQCLTPVPVKPGQCSWRSFIPVCGDRCQNDSDCSGEKKCCPKRCGRACEDPITRPESQ